MTGLVQDGLVPYRDWGFEYPPLAIVPIALGGAFGNTEAIYPVTFGAADARLPARAAGAGSARSPGAAAMWAVALSPLVLGAMVRTHYDALPAAMVAGALAAVRARADDVGVRGARRWAR